MGIIYNRDYMAIGKHKQATVRIILAENGEGRTIVNKMFAHDYFQYNLEYIETVRSPLKELDLHETYDIVAIVKGGGLKSQVEAMRLGVARMLCIINPRYRSKLKAAGFLTRDARIKERKKYGLRKARKAPQYSKR